MAKTIQLCRNGELRLSQKRLSVARVHRIIDLCATGPAMNNES